MTKQKISSAATCVKKVPAAFNKFNKMFDRPEHHWLDVADVLDYGGGKYDVFSAVLAEFRVRTFVYDPFNRSPEHNATVLQLLQQRPADMAFCNCVLNVIQEKEARAEVIANVRDLVKPGGKIVFSFYEGDKSGKGKITSKGFQANRRVESYENEIRKHFKGRGHGSSVVWNGLIVIDNPIKLPVRNG